VPGQKSFPRVVVPDNGGTLGELKVTTQEPILQHGEHGILFPQPDTRFNQKSIAALPRQEGHRNKQPTQQSNITTILTNFRSLDTHIVGFRNDGSPPALLCFEVFEQ
jgi:hypothetical protein